MIRRLQSNRWEDFYREVRQVDAGAGEVGLKQRLNPELTFKCCHLSAGEFDRLRKYAFQNANSCRTVLGKTDSMILSFSSGEAVDTFLSAGEMLPEKFRAEFRELLSNYELSRWEFDLPGGKWRIDRPLIMGILNVTPDSFSDGGKFLDPVRAADHALKMAEDGADLIDIGAESTRPGAGKVDTEEEWRRIEPVLARLRPQLRIPFSVDTYKAEIARRALAEGADIVNDISGLTFDPGMMEVAAAAGVPVILMHIQGIPGNMQKNPYYENVMEEIHEFFTRQIAAAGQNGIRQLILDPGIGFGKRLQDNLELIRRLSEFRALGWPLLIGTSRKSFIGKILADPAADRTMGTAASVALAIANGAQIIRVHDVREMKQAAMVTAQITGTRTFSQW